jgi:hypothetical protein
MVSMQSFSRKLSFLKTTADNRVFAAAGQGPFAQMAFVTAAARAPAAPTGPFGPDGHLANTTNVIRNRVKRI